MVHPSASLSPLLALLVLLAGCGGGDTSPGDPAGGGEGTPGEPAAPAEPGTPGDGTAGAPPSDAPGTGAPGEPGAGGGGPTPGGNDDDAATPPEGGGTAGGGAGGDGTGGGGAAGGGTAGGGTGSGPEPSGPASTPPGTTVFARKLGGAGEEVGVGPLAFDANGGFVALSKFGVSDDGPASWMNFGLARFDAAGALRWSRSYPTQGDDLRNEAVAISPLGNVFLGFENETSMDLGGGPLPYGHAVVVKLAPDGRFVWQRTFDGGGFSGLSVDGSGSVLVAVGQYVAKLRWDGEQLWRWSFPGDAVWDPAKVAFDPAGLAIVAVGNHVYKLDAEGDEVWKASFVTSNFVQVEYLGTTAKGTVVAAGKYYGSFSYAGTTLEGESEYGSGAFLAVIEADGRPRWARARGSHAGPIAVDPAGRLALLEDGNPELGCDDVLAAWDLTGRELWRRPVAVCPHDLGRGTFARGVGVAPSGAVWVQGIANAPFDLGTGTLAR